MTEDWMRALSMHAEEMRRAYPVDELVVVFDIDGTIIDTRHLVAHALLSFDRHRGTNHFRGITPEDVVEHETRVDGILDAFPLPEEVRRQARAWYLRWIRDPRAIGAAHLPYQGVMSVIRWFQLQPRTHVALNTGRPEAMRAMTLASLNALGRQHRVVFEPSLLFMCRAEFAEDVGAAKVDALRRLHLDGYRVMAAVDNEPSMIRAMADADETGEVLFLHADTIFASRRERTPRTVSGSAYGLTGLIDEAEVGRRVTLVWHGVNGSSNLRRFIASGIRWAELDIRRDPLGQLVLRHDSFLETPWARGEELMALRDCLDVLRREGRSVKLDLKEGGEVIEEVLELVRSLGFRDKELWFNASIENVGPRGFSRLREGRPGAIRQCPIDFLVPLFSAAPEQAHQVLRVLRASGVGRASLDWRTPGGRMLLDVLEGLGWEINLYGVPDLGSFLEAALLLPTSLTADFNFPEWHYHGTGPGQDVARRRSDAGEVRDCSRSASDVSDAARRDPLGSHRRGSSGRPGDPGAPSGTAGGGARRAQEVARGAGGMVGRALGEANPPGRPSDAAGHGRGDGAAMF